jgi:hypothetical protein
MSTTDPPADRAAAVAGRHRRATDPAANPGSAVPFSGYAGRAGPAGSYPRPMSRDQRTTVIYGILCFCLVLVVLQLWPLIATTNAYLGGDASVIWPGAAASAACLALNVGLLRYLYAIERQ